MSIDAELTPSQLVELVRDDQRHRWLKGERVFIEAYLERYPPLRDNHGGLIDCIYGEYLLREELNDGPEIDDYLRRFSEFAAALRRQFELHTALESGGALLDPGDPRDEQHQAGTAGSAGWTTRELPIKFGDYELLEEISRGAMGVVFKARQTSLNRVVAVKLILAGQFAGPEQVRRFHREAEAMAGLRHPNIVAIHEVGMHEGRHYLAMQYVAGRSLADVRRDRRLTPREAALSVRRLADAIQHVHDQGILHRDLKPSNVLVDESGRPRITDFGLAKYTRGNADLTSPDAMVGTPNYMPPEAACGRRGTSGPAIDIYSLGAILYELVADRPPFSGDTPLETLWQVLHSEPPALRLFNPRVPRDLETICTKCLEKHPARRYASAGALANDLQRFLNGEPTVARPLGAVGQMWKWVLRKPAVAALVAVTMVALVGGLVGTAWHTVTLRKALDVAEQRRTEAQNLSAMASLREQRVRQYLYAADMKLADEAWKRSHILQTINILNRYRDDPPAEDLRTFAWHRLWSLCNRHELQLSGHDGDVYCVDFSSEGSLVATCGADGTARLWDARTGEQRRVLRGHTGELSSVRFSPKGEILATCGDDKTVRLWDVSSGRELAQLRGHGAGVFAIAFSPDGTLLASGAQDRQAKIWNVQRRAEQQTLTGHKGAIESLEFSPDGRILATGSGNRTVKLWQVADGTERATLLGHSGVVLCVAFSPDGKVLASGSEDRTVMLWEVADGKNIGTLVGHAEVVQSVAFSPDGRTVAAAVKDGTVQLWNVGGQAPSGREETNPPGNAPRVPDKPARQLRGHTGRIWYLAYRLATASGDGTVRVWDLTETVDRRRLALSPNNRVQSLAFSSKAGHFVTATGRREDSRVVNVRHLRSGIDTNPSSYDERSERKFVAMSPDGNSQAYARRETKSPRHTVKVTNVRSGGIQSEMTATINDNIANATAALIRAAVSSGGQFVALAFEEGTLVLWDMTEQTQVRLVGHADGIDAVQFSPDGTMLASGGRDHSVILWDTSTASRRSVLRDHGGAVRALAFSPDGRILAAGGVGRTLILWDVAEKDRLAILPPQDADVECLAFSPKGRTLVSGGADGTVKLWDVATRQEVGQWQGHAGPVSAAAFSDDGKSLVSGGMTNKGESEFLLWCADTPVSGSVSP